MSGFETESLHVGLFEITLISNLWTNQLKNNVTTCVDDCTVVGLFVITGPFQACECYTIFLKLLDILIKIRRIKLSIVIHERMVFGEVAPLGMDHFFDISK